MVCNGCNFSLRAFVLLLASRQLMTDMLANHGVLNKTTQCPTCHEQVDLNINSFRFTCDRRYRTHKNTRKCRFRRSGKNGTWFASSKLQFEDIMYLTVLWLKLPHPRQAFITKELSCTNETVVNWSSFCREVCIEWSLNTSVKLGGIGTVVEIDEAKFGRRKYNRGRIIEGKWIFGGFQRNNKNIFLVPVENRTSQTLLAVIQEWILPGTTIVSDCWKSYDILRNEGFEHLKINHSLNFVDPQDPQVHTQNIERTWRNVRGGIPRYGRQEAHMVGYLAEFLFKRRYSGTEDVHHFLMEIARLYPPFP